MVLQKLSNKKVGAGSQIITYVMFSVVSISYLFLVDIDNPDTSQLFGNLLFYLMLLGSSLFLFMVAFTPIAERKLQGDKSARFFFFTDVGLDKFVIWVPLGILGSFGMALLSQNLGLGSIDASLFSIGASGTVMMVIFFVTRTILIPMIIHATFNVLVIALRDGIIASDLVGISLVPIPDVGVSFSQVNQFLTDSLVQYTLVAPAEEMLKMLILGFIVLGIPNAKFKDGISKYIGAFFALLVWSSFHAIQAITA